MSTGEERGEEQTGRRARPTTLLAILLAVFALFAMWKVGRGYNGFDFYQFWTVGQAVSERLVDNVYDDADRAEMGAVFFERAKSEGLDSRRMAVAKGRQFIKTWSTPFLYTTFGVLASGDYERDYTLFRLLCLTGTVIGLTVLARGLGFGLGSSLLFLALALQFFTPLLADVRSSNVNQIQLGVLAGILFLGVRRGAPALVGCGVLCGVLVGFKPNLGLVVLLLTGLEASRRRWDRLGRLALGFTLGLALAIIAAGLYFGDFGAWSDWTSFLGSAMYSERAMTVAHGNASLDRLLFEAHEFHVGTFLLPALIVAFGVVLWRRRGNLAAGCSLAQEVHWATAVGLLVNLLSAPLTFGHYYVFALPAVLFCLRPGLPGEARAAWRRSAGAVALVAFYLPQFFAGSMSGAQALSELKGWTWSSASVLLLAALLVCAPSTRERDQST